MNSVNKYLRPIFIFVAAVSGMPLFALPSPNDEIHTYLVRYHEIRGSMTRDSDEKAETNKIVERLNQQDTHAVASQLLSAIQDASSRKQIGSYAALLPKLHPEVKAAVLARLIAEPDANQKARLVRALYFAEGSDVVKALFSQLNDTRPADIDGNAASTAMRVCDYAFNRIYMLVRNIPELELNAGTEMSDAIQIGVPVEWRDARIAKLKAGMIKKFGRELSLQDNL